MSLKIDELINDLSRQLKPVKVIKFTWLDVLRVMAVGFFCLLSAVAILGLRVDFSEQKTSLHFGFEILLLILLGVVSIFAVFKLSVPTLEGQKFNKPPIIVLTLFFLSTLYSFLIVKDPFLYLGHGFSCVAQMVLISILPASILFYSIQRAAVLNRGIVGALVLISAVSFGLLGVHLTCSDSTPMHMTLWHIIPSWIVIALGIGLARKVFKKI